MNLEDLIDGKKSRELITLSCSHCGVLFERTKTEIQKLIRLERTSWYCSKACSDLARKTPTKNCLCCGKEFHQSSVASKFCSRSCSAKYNNILRGKKETRTREQFLRDMREKKDEEIRIGLEDGTLTDSKRQTTKSYLIRTRGHVCEICGTTEWNGQPVPLVLDHIDGNSSNNLGTNLRLVCGNCDMQLPTYKSKNKGNGRAYRRKRYVEGKSF